MRVLLINAQNTCRYVTNLGSKILTRIYGPVVEQGIWRIRTNQELGELCKDLDIVADIKRRIGIDWICSKSQ